MGREGQFFAQHRISYRGSLIRDHRDAMRWYDQQCNFKHYELVLSPLTEPKGMEYTWKK